MAHRGLQLAAWSVIAWQAWAAAGTAEVLDVQPDRNDRPGLPAAAVAADGVLRAGAWLLLDASGSRDPAGEELHFEWSQTAGPSLGFSAEEARASKLWLFFAEHGEYRIALRVRNKAGWSTPTQLKLNVEPGLALLPLSEARKIAGAGERIALPGEGWRQVRGPGVQLRPAEGGCFFRPVQPGLFVFEAPRMGDAPERRGISVPAGREAGWGDRRPVAEFAAKNPVTKPNQPVILDASLSRDPDGPEETAALQALWTTPDKHRGADLEPLPGLQAAFKAPRAGVYGVSLAVSDGRLSSTPETLYVRVEEADAQGSAAQAVLPPWEEIPEFQREDIRHKAVRLGLWESHLQRAINLFPSRCGAALRVDSDVALPGTFESVPLHLEVLDAPLRHLLDWIARQTDTFYRCEGSGSFWLTRATGWVKNEELKSFVLQVDALYERADGSDLMNTLLPPFQRIAASRPGLTVIFEPARQEIVGLLPVSAVGRLSEICAALRAPESLPITEFLENPDSELRRTLANKMITLQVRGRRLDYALRDLSSAAGVAAGFDPRQFPQGFPRVDLDLKDVPLREAVRTLAAAAGFDGCSAELPSGLWFYKGAAPYPSSELLWERSFVRTYDTGKLLAGLAPLSGEALVHAIRSRIYPQTWNDPGALCLYHAPKQRLLVMHGAAAHRRIAEFLMDLAARGEWALGPVETRP